MPFITVTFLRYTKIDCPTRNFCSIKWFHNSSPIVYGNYIELDNDNQTLQIQQAFYWRAGNYTCVATDGTESISRTVELFIAGLYESPQQLPSSEKLCVHRTSYPI